MPKTVLEFGEWNPDGGPVNNSGMWFVRNALKITDDYEGFPIITNVADGPNSGADAPLGTHYHIKRTGKKPLIFWGTSSKIYVAEEETDLSAETWYDASGAAYTASEWNYVSFGPTVIATNGTDALQGYTVADTFDSAANFGNLLTTTGPTSADIKPKHLAVYKNHVFAANITMGATYSQFTNAVLYPELVWWSDTDNAARFGDLLNTSELKGSGWFLLYDGQGEITGMAVAGDVLYVFKERAVYRCDGFPFTFSKVSDGIGTTQSKSIIVLNNEVYFWGAVGPCKINTNGQVVRLGIDSCYRSLGDAALNNFPAQGSTGVFDIEQSGKVYAFPDAVNDLAVFVIHTSDDDIVLNSATGNKIFLVYNARTDKFYYGEVNNWLGDVAYEYQALYPFVSSADTGSVFNGLRFPALDSTTYKLLSMGTSELGSTAIYFRLPFVRFGEGASRITKVRPLLGYYTDSTGPTFIVSIITRQHLSTNTTADVQDPRVESSGSKSGWITIDSGNLGIAHSIGLGIYMGGGRTGNTAVFRDIAGIEVEYAPLGVRGA